MPPVIRISPRKSKSLPPSLFGFSSCEFLRFISVIQAVKMPNSSKKTSKETPESSKKASKSKGKGKTDSFVWSVNEVELLLKVTHEYKVSRASENIDWETCQTKYSDICELLHEQYASSKDAEEIGKDYPHSKEEITKGAVTTKLKAIRQKYRAAVDSGRKSGHGSVVLIFLFFM